MSKASKSNKMQSYKIPEVQSVPYERKKIYPIPASELEIVKKRSTDKLLFSFKFFDRETKAFNLAETKQVCDNWYINLFDILKEVSNINRNQLIIEQRQFYDAHAINFEKLDYKYPFVEDFIEQVECIQFRLSKSKGRVHGFIVGNRFYVVWLDPHHNLYPDEKYGGIKLFNRPLSCYELLENHILELQSIREELEHKIINLQNENDDLLKEHETTLKILDNMKQAETLQSENDNVLKKTKQEKYKKKIKKREEKNNKRR